jgi:hypothetical protein
MVSSILWDQSARRAAFTLPFPSTPWTARESRRAALREGCQQTRVTHDDGNRFQYEWPGNIQELQNVIERPFILSKSPPSCRRPTPRYDGFSPIEWLKLVSRRMLRKNRNGDRVPPRRRCASRNGMDCALRPHDQRAQAPASCSRGRQTSRLSAPGVARSYRGRGRG